MHGGGHGPARFYGWKSLRPGPRAQALAGAALKRAWEPQMLASSGGESWREGVRNKQISVPTFLPTFIFLPNQRKSILLTR